MSSATSSAPAPRYRVEQLAAACDVSVDTVRYYQAKGLLPQPEREGRVAWYRHDHLERIRSIRALKRQGLTLAAIRRVLEGDLDLADAGLAAAVAAAVARALDDGTDAAARVWIVTGGGLFVLTGLATLLDVHPRTTWSLLLLLAMLSARVVPTIAVDVPDNYLIDMDRLAITAWSAREQPRGRRGRVVVPEAA
ncbi:MAG TPA: MerR family transcriptional regulator, partial [Actinomycetota bacterium]